jgi:hypothetical protein
LNDRLDHAAKRVKDWFCARKSTKLAGETLNDGQPRDRLLSLTSTISSGLV